MSSTTSATNGAQNTTISGSTSSLFVNGILLSANSSKQERWLASEYPDVLKRINQEHDDSERDDIIDHMARKLGSLIKREGGTVTLPDVGDNEFVVTHHAEADDHNRFIPNSADPQSGSETCPDCGSDMHSQILQTRSADEAGTEIFKCSDPTCSHTERRND